MLQGAVCESNNHFGTQMKLMLKLLTKFLFKCLMCVMIKYIEKKYGISCNTERGTFLTHFLTAQQSCSSIFSSVLGKSVTGKEVLERYPKGASTMLKVTPNESGSKDYTT